MRDARSPSVFAVSSNKSKKVPSQLSCINDYYLSRKLYESLNKYKDTGPIQ